MSNFNDSACSGRVRASSSVASSVRSWRSVGTSRSWGPRSPAGTTTGWVSGGAAGSSWDGRGCPTSSPMTRSLLPDDAWTDGRPRSDWSSGALRDCSHCLVHGLLGAVAPGDRECHELTGRLVACCPPTSGSRRTRHRGSRPTGSCRRAERLGYGGMVALEGRRATRRMPRPVSDSFTPAGQW